MGDELTEHWFEAIAQHLGRAYLRYSFTKGTDQEAAFLVEALELKPGMRVLDVGCGPGRHAHALARLGHEVVGLDISERFVEIAREDAPPGASFVRGDARDMTFHAEFDAAVSMCQGAFGLSGPGADGDPRILAGVAAALRPRGRFAVTAFNAFFRIRYPGDGTFDVATGIDHEVTRVRDESGASRFMDLWTTCFTPRELRFLLSAAGLDVTAIWCGEPGAYARVPPDAEHPELFAVARRRA